MAEPRLVILGIIAAVLVLAIVLGSAALALGDSFREVHTAKKRRAEEAPPSPPSPRPQPRPRPRSASERGRLRWYSPEIIAVLLLTVAAGLWLVRLVGS